MAMDAETKTLFDEQAKTWEEFKSKNDELVKQVDKLKTDAVTKDEQKKLNEAMDAIGDKIAEAKKRSDEIEAKMNRLSLGGGSEAEGKRVEDYRRYFAKADASLQDVNEYKDAFEGFVRKGEVKAVTAMVGSDPAGGYFVTPDMSGRIVAKVYESTPMRQLANVSTIGTDALEGPIDNDQPTATWVGEQTTRAQTDTPLIGKWSIAAEELYAYPMVTLRLLDDAKIDLEAWLSDKVAGLFARKEATAFVTGDGVLKPRGIADYTTAATADGSRAWGVLEHVATGSSGAFDVSSKNGTEKILTLMYALKAAYRQNASFLAARGTVGAIRALKDSTYQYIWEPSTQAGQPATLFGYPLAEGEDVAAIAANSLSLAFGDFKAGYEIVDRLGITLVARDVVTSPGFVKFHFRKRVGGGVVNFEAIKWLKFA